MNATRAPGTAAGALDWEHLRLDCTTARVRVTDREQDRPVGTATLTMGPPWRPGGLVVDADEATWRWSSPDADARLRLTADRTLSARLTITARGADAAVEGPVVGWRGAFACPAWPGGGTGLALLDERPSDGLVVAAVQTRGQVRAAGPGLALTPAGLELAAGRSWVSAWTIDVHPHRAGALAALRAQAGRARLTACVSDPVRRWVERLVPGCRAATVPNGVSLERIRPSREDPGGVVVVFVGTLKPWHGVDDLLRAAAMARAPWSLRIIGDGPQMPALRALAGGLGLDVDFRGEVAPERIPAHLAGAAIAVAPYPDLGGADEQYFSPLKVLEYLAAGLPVVGSAVGQLPGMLRGSGVLVPPSDPARLAGAIDALALDADERARLGAAGRRAAEERHGWDRVVADVLCRLGPEGGAS